MKRLLMRFLAAGLCLWAVPTFALLTGVSVNPSSTTLSTVTNSVVNLNWSVSADASHAEGASSTQAQLFELATGNPLGGTGAMLNQAGGGPFNFSETLTFSLTNVLSWQSAGIGQIEVRRSFADVTGRVVMGSMVVTVPVRGNITGASVNPLQSSLNATTNSSVALTWRINATATYSAGVSAAPGRGDEPGL